MQFVSVLVHVELSNLPLIWFYSLTISLLPVALPTCLVCLRSLSLSLHTGCFHALTTIAWLGLIAVREGNDPHSLLHSAQNGYAKKYEVLVFAMNKHGVI